MQIGLAVVWLIFAALFYRLGRFYGDLSKRNIPPFGLTRRRFSESDSPIRVSVNVAGTPLDQPLEDFAAQFNEYLGDENAASSRVNLGSAWGAYLAAATALLSATVEIYTFCAGL